VALCIAGRGGSGDWVLRGLGWRVAWRLAVEKEEGSAAAGLDAGPRAKACTSALFGSDLGAV
jgi:hypothetical protein